MVRDAATGPTRDRDARTGRRRTAKASRDGLPPAAPARPPPPSDTRPSGPRRPGGVPVREATVDGLVVGTVPPAARLTGGLLVAAALVALVSVFPTYLVVDGRALAPTRNLTGLLAVLVGPTVSLAVGWWLARGAVPKFGLAFAQTAGALAFGQLLIELYRGRSSTARSAVEVLAGERVLTTGVEVGAGWVLGLVSLGLAVAAGVVGAIAWGRTVMDDDGPLDAVRSRLAGAAVLLGVGTVLCLALPAADVPDQLVTDPVTGLQTVVTVEGPQALLERPGMALLGGLLLAGAVVLCSVIAPSLRPRLALVGSLLAITVTVLSAAVTGLRDAVSSDALDWTVPGTGLVVTGLGYALLTAVAWRLRRGSGTAAPRP